MAVWLVIVLPYGAIAGRRLATEGVNDFTIFRLAGARAAEKRALYGPLSAAELRQWPYESLANLNLPHTHVLLRPLAAISYEAAASAWAMASLGLVALSLVAIARELELRLNAWTIWVGGAFVLGSAPFISTAVSGELSFLLMAPFTAGWIAARRGQHTAAGAWLGLCAAVKPFLAVYFCYLVLTRRTRAAGAFVVVVFCAVALGAALYGLDAYLQWLGAVRQVRWWWPTENASLRGFAERLFVPGHGMTPLVDAPVAATWIAGIGAIIVLLASAWNTRRVPSGTSHTDADVGAWLCASLLASPLGWIYYVPMLTGPLLGALTDTSRRRGRGWIAAGAGLLMVPLSVTELGQPSPIATLLLASTYTWALAALWLGFLFASRSGRAPDAEPT